MIQIDYLLPILQLSLPFLNVGKFFPFTVFLAHSPEQGRQLACSSWLREDRRHRHSQCDTHIQPDLLNKQTPNSPEPSAGLPQASPSCPVLSCPTGVQAGNPLSAKERQQELRQRLPSLLLLSLPLISSPHQVITQLTCGWWDGRKRGVWGGSTFSPAPLHHKPLQTLNRGPDRKARKESNHCQAG